MLVMWSCYNVAINPYLHLFLGFNYFLASKVVFLLPEAILCNSGSAFITPHPSWAYAIDAPLQCSSYFHLPFHSFLILFFSDFLICFPGMIFLPHFLCNHTSYFSDLFLLEITATMKLFFNGNSKLQHVYENCQANNFRLWRYQVTCCNVACALQNAFNKCRI